MKILKKEKSLPLFSLFLCLIIILGVWLMMLVSDTGGISEEENRALADLPTFSASALYNGEFFSGLSEFISDNFPLRDPLSSIYACGKILTGEGESNGVFFGKDGYLIKRGDYESLDTAKKNLAATKALSEKLGGADIAIIPRACDVMTEKLPPLYNTRRAEEINRLIASVIPESSALQKNILTGLSSIEAPFYRTDHHWTSAGAYEAYRALCSHLGVSPLPTGHFTPTTVSHGFRGTLSSSSSLRYVSPDSVELYRFEGDTKYKISSEDALPELSSFYHLSALDEKDKYKVFLGGNHPLISIREEGAEGKPRLLLIKDSFANSLIPFLAIHFDIDVIDPRYATLPVSEMTDTSAYDKILFLFGADTLATTAMYKKLR